jgi:hypothetical protein
MSKNIIFLSPFTVVDDLVVDYIQTENIEIMNEKSQENMNTYTKINGVLESVLKHDNSAKEENPQPIIQIENVISNDSITNMLPTTSTSEFSVNNFQLHDSDYINIHFQEYIFKQRYDMPKIISNNEEFDLCAKDNDEEIELRTRELMYNFKDREAFHLICSNSHYSSYPDIFTDLKSFDDHLKSPLLSDVFLVKRGVTINLVNDKILVSFDQNNKLLNDYSLNNYENFQ